MGTFTGRGADILVECLVRAGVGQLFGVPGDTGVIFYDALYDRTGDIRHVLARDERHAAAMADGFARASNSVGVVEVSSGGGTTYVVGGLGEAYAAAVPVLLITSDIHTASRGSGALTEIDQEALFQAVTKWRATALSAAAIPSLVAAAFAEITSGRPAPGALIVPEDILDQEATVAEAELSALDGVAGQLPRERPSAATEDLDRAVELIAGATNPAILAGSGVHLSNAYAQLGALATDFGIPVATTIHGRGVISDANRWNIGVAGNNGGREYVNAYLREADVVLVIGTRANATDTDGFTAPARSGESAPSVIAIDIDPSRLEKNYPDALVLTGDVRTILAGILERLPAAPMARQERLLTRFSDVRNQWEAKQRELVSLPDHQLMPADVIRTVRAAVPDSTVVVADPGTPTPNVATYWAIADAGRTVVVPRGHGPMGYAIPAAVGVALAHPGQPVVALTADGSFNMACGELETVSRLNLPIVFVQFTNHSMGWIKMLQHLYTGKRYFGVDPGTVDAAAIARASGVRGLRATDLETVKAAVTEAVRTSTPVYLDVEVPHMIDHSPPVPAWARALAGDTERPVY